jgi:flagellar basal body rod protein FlgB
MKLIEGLKLVKELLVKAEDLRKRIATNSALLNIETPAYKDQKAQVASWLQAHEDLTREIARLKVRIAKTNLQTQVTIAIGDKQVTKCITEWIVRRKETAALDQTAWAGLTDRNLKEQNLKTSADGPVTEVRIVRFFDSLERDFRVDQYRQEPSLIDRTLEVTNAVTDLVD